MKKFVVLAALLLCGVCVGLDAGELRFSPDGKFKIVQFTDLHFNADKAESRIVLKRMKEVVEAERPDLVVITGDLIYSFPAEKALRAVIGAVSELGVPFCTVWGNHDAQYDLSKGSMYDIVRSYEGCVMPERGERDSPDYSLEVKASDGSGSTAALLYCIDSNMHLYDSGGNFTGYDFIHEDQVAWYRTRSLQYTLGNGGAPYPALAFFHIPLPEFHDAQRDESCTLIGTRMEAACAPEHNSGLFDAIKDCGDVMGVFVGHDHDNDYAVMYRDVLLSYGRFTGGNTEYNNLPNGARVIILKEGERSFDSYVVLKGGVKINPITYPDSFRSTPWRGRPLDPECL